MDPSELGVMNMSEILRIERVVAEFNVWLGETLPFAKMKVKVLEQNGTGYLAITNLHVLNKSSREPEYISGLGATVDDALKDVLSWFVQIVQRNATERGFNEADFAWSAPEDF